MYVHAQRTRPAKGFVALANAASEHTLDMRIRLTQSNPEGLQRVLEQVSDPASPRYGQYLTRQEVCHPSRDVLRSPLNGARRLRSSRGHRTRRARPSTTGSRSTA